MFFNLLRFLLLILVFDSTLSVNQIPPLNQNSLEYPSFDDNYKKLVKHEFISEKTVVDDNNPNGKSMKGNSNGEESKNLSEIEFLTLEDPNDNFLKLKPNPVISNSEQNEKANREGTKKDNFNNGDDLCNTTENRLYKDSEMHPCDKNPEEFIFNSPKASDPYEYESTLNRKTELNPLVDNDNEVLKDSIIEPDLGGRNSKSKTEKSNLERSLKYTNDSIENPDSDFVENPYLSLSNDPLEKTIRNFFSSKEKKSGLDFDGPVNGRILTKHHASHNLNQSKKGTVESVATHHDPKKKVSRIDQLVINQQSKVIKTKKSKGSNKKNSESERKSDDASMLNVGPKTIISSETTLLSENVSPKDADITEATAVKEHNSKGRDGYNLGKVSDVEGNSHKKSDVKNQNPLNSSLVKSGKDETGEKVPLGNFRIKDSRKNELDESHIKQHEVKLSRNERIPEADRVYKSEIFNNDPWRLDPADTNDYNDGSFPIVLNSQVSRDVSHTRKNKSEDEDIFIKDLGVQNKAKLSKIPEDKKRRDSREKSKIFTEDPLNLGLDYDSGTSDADINSHRDGPRNDKPSKSSFQNEAQLPYTEQVPEDDKATTPTHLDTTQESLSDSLKVLFFNQSLYQEVIHLVKTDRNVQAYVFNVLLLYIPVLICDVLLWLVIFKLLRHIHRQFLSNRLNSAPSAPEKQEVEIKEDSAPERPKCMSHNNKEAVKGLKQREDKEAAGDDKNAESNPQTEGTWYPPK